MAGSEVTMTQPVICPPFGICVPVIYRRARDGDTIEVSLPQSRWIWAVRLLDCWVDDHGTDEFRRDSTAYAESVCQGADRLVLFVPFNVTKVLRNILSMFTFDRILGYLYVTNDRTLNEMMVTRGFATFEKPRKRKR